MSGMLFPLPLAALTLSSFSSTPHLVKTRTTTHNHMARQTRAQHRVIAAISASHHQFLPLTRLPRPAQPRVSPHSICTHTIDINLHHTTLRIGH